MDELLITAVAELDEDKVIEIVNQRLEEGIDPLYIQKQIQSGMKKVGQLYETGEYFIADLIMSGIIFKEVLKIDKMKPDKRKPNKGKMGKLLLGTAYGDLHDVGKDIFGSMMESTGFEVYDLGINVPVKTFVEKIREIQPDIIGISGVLTLALESMKDTVEGITEAGLRDLVKIIIGGSPVTEEACIYIGADAYTVDATEGVKICKQWMMKPRKYTDKY